MGSSAGLDVPARRADAADEKARVAEAVYANLWNAATAVKQRGINTCRNILVVDYLDKRLTNTVNYQLTTLSVDRTHHLLPFHYVPVPYGRVGVQYTAYCTQLRTSSYSSTLGTE